jgi:hypothetical protein
MSDRPPIALADIERRIRILQSEIAELRQLAMRTDEIAAMPGAQIRAWMVGRGATNREVTDLIVAANAERRNR